MQRVGDFALEMHKKYYHSTGPSYEEYEFNKALDEINQINLAKPKDERIRFPRDDIQTKEDMTPVQMEHYMKTR